MGGLSKDRTIIDEKNALILNLLQEDCRMSLTKMAQKVGLSVDSVRKRLEKMKKRELFRPKVQVRPRNLGFSNVADIKIKLHNYSPKEMQELIDYLYANPQVVEIFAITGTWDLSIVVISQSPEDLGKLSEIIRGKFSKIINEWSESLTTCAYKFERYDVLKLLGYNLGMVKR